MSGAAATLTPNKTKIAEAILYLISRAEQLGKRVTQYDIVKSVFIADTSHIATYGRPITYDNYFAMKHGPVPSETYDMLKAEHQELEGWPLWRRTPLNGSSTCVYDRPTRAANLAKLSISERHELDAAQDIVWSQGFQATKDLTHKNPAYLAAWKEDPALKAFPMNYLLLVEGDEDVLHEIEFASRHR